MVLVVLAPSSQTSNHNPDMSLTEAVVRMSEVDPVEFFRKPPELVAFLRMHRRSHSPSQHKSLPAFTTWIQFSKRWSSRTCGGKSFCCQQPAPANTLFQCLPQATGCREFYYTDIIARWFHTYLSSQTERSNAEKCVLSTLKILKNIFQTYNKNIKIRKNSLKTPFFLSPRNRFTRFSSLPNYKDSWLHLATDARG